MRILIATLTAVLLALPAQSATIEEALAAPDRLTADRERDGRSHPADIVALLGIGPGSRVADIFAGGGYYSELLGRVVSPGGEVLMHNNDAYLEFVEKGLKARFEGREVSAVTRHDREVNDLDLGEGTLDAAMIIMSYHDLYMTDEGWPAIDADNFMGQVVTALKPGGRFVIVDHSAVAGSGISQTGTIHRIEESVARSQIESYGLKYVGGTEVLRNPDDDLTLNVFDKEIVGKTDRFVQVFEKP